MSESVNRPSFIYTAYPLRDRDRVAEVLTIISCVAHTNI